VSLLLEAGKRYQVMPHTMHIINAEVVIAEGAETVGGYVKLFTSDDPDTQESDENVWTLPLGRNIGSSTWTPDLLEGMIFQRGLFADVRCTDATVKVVINVLGVKREHYTPAYPDPNEHLTNAWRCSHGEDEFLENFDTGGNNSWDNDGDTGAAGGVLPGALED
jgi:hypothetical protein